MNGDFDLHQLLGALKADMQASLNQRAELFAQVRETTRLLTTLAAETRHYAEQSTRLHGHLAALAARVTLLENFKQRLLGIVFIVAAATGVAWDYLKRIISL